MISITDRLRPLNNAPMKLPTVLILVSLLACLGPLRAADTTPGGPSQTPDPKSILAGLRPEHPRLILTESDWKTFRAARGGSGTVAQILAVAEKNARALLDKPPVTYKKEGRRLLSVSREAMRRIELCSFAYRLTDEKIFLKRAEREMLAVAAFADWNPSHFLDTAEMTAGLALGYDWLFADLSPATRATVREAMVEKGLKLGIALEGKSWQRAQMNWNQVCFGGLTLGALAIADEAPDVAAALLQQARTYNHHGQGPYAPDGVYPEGPGYFNYGTGYEIMLISALETALGTDWNSRPPLVSWKALPPRCNSPALADSPSIFPTAPPGNPFTSPGYIGSPISGEIPRSCFSSSTGSRRNWRRTPMLAMTASGPGWPSGWRVCPHPFRRRRYRWRGRRVGQSCRHLPFVLVRSRRILSGFQRRRGQ